LSQQEELQRKLRAGVDAAKSGDRATARRLLEQVIDVDENNEMAWIWLASSVSTVSERRACLERVLEINPNNTRAREALHRLGDTPTVPPVDEQARIREQIERVRRAGGASSPIGGGRGGSNAPLYYLAAAVVAVLVVGAVALSALNQTTDDLPPTSAAVVAVTDTPTVTLTPTLTSTPAPMDVSQITRNAPTLPPTFTPTFTPSPTFTLQPSATPPGLDTYGLFYISLNSGADQPDGYTVLADRSNEGSAFNEVRDLAYSADGSQIVFIRDVGGAPEVFIAEANNPDAATQLTTLGAPDTAHPTFSPDGSQIAFSSSADSQSEEIHLMDSNGDNLRRITNNTWVDRDPAFSPVENLIVFTSDQDSPDLTELYTLTFPQFEDEDPIIQRLTNTDGNNYSPSWSQNGQYLVFASDRNGASDIFWMEFSVGGTGFLVTYDDLEVENRNPAISHDGRWIAFVSNRDGDTFQTYLVDTLATEVIRLTDNGRDDVGVVFQPVPTEQLIFPTEIPTLALEP
jgi:Tol biopolymer transport system component